MRRAKLKYSIQQNKKKNSNILYEVLTCRDSWIYVECFKLHKAKKMLKEMEDKNEK